MPEDKYCRKCKEFKSLKFFTKDISKSDGFRTYCKECMKVNYKNYYNSNKDKVLKSTAKYKERNKDWCKNYANCYREENRERLKEKGRDYYIENREHVLIQTGIWAKNNPRRRALIDNRRRARKLNQLGIVSDNIETIMWENQEGKCFYCKCYLFENKYHQEHKTPLSRGGLHDDSNLCLSCPTCNFKKGSKTAEEFYPQEVCYP